MWTPSFGYNAIDNVTITADNAFVKAMDILVNIQLIIHIIHLW